MMGNHAFVWTYAEPAENNFVWVDDSISSISTAGFDLLGSIDLDGAASIPSYGKLSDGSVDLSKLYNFVYAIVNHYKPWVHYWEIGNEPNGTWNAAQYAPILKTSVDAVKAADPQANIVAMGGSGYPYMNDVISQLQTQYPAWNWQNYINIFSTHAYPGGYVPEDFKPQVLTPLNVTGWNTESGAWDMGFLLGDYSGFHEYVNGTPIWPFYYGDRFYRASLTKPESVVANFIRSIGSGMTKYFYYVSWTVEYRLNTDASHPSIMESDDSIRPKGIAYAIAGSFIDKSTALGNIASDPNTFAFLFDRNGIPTLALWSKDGTPKQLATALLPSQFVAYDLMGSRIPILSGNIPFGRSPMYVVGQNISVSDFKTAVSGAVSPRLDTTAPNLSIVSGPRDTIHSSTVRLRWIAIDDTSIPNQGSLDPEMLSSSCVSCNPNALLYSYKLLPVETQWSSWTAETVNTYANLPNGTYTFDVIAKDEAGNVSPIVSRAFTVSNPSASLASGDVSGNSTVTIYDAALAFRDLMVGGTCSTLTAQQCLNAQMDGQGNGTTIDSADVLSIAKKAVGL